MMKTPISFILSVLFLVSSIANASSFLGKAPESGIIISVNPEKSPSKSGESVLISGTIKYVKKSQSKPKDDVPNGGDKKHGLLEEFKAQGIDIVGTFPSSAVDVSSELTLENVSDHEIRFSFQSKSIIADDLNQFTLKVYNNHTNKGALKKLSVIQAKLERRLQLLANLKKKFESGKASKEAIVAIEKEIAKLSAITTKIEDKLNTDENLMAENTYALQVDNLTSNYSKISTVMNDFRFLVNSDIGSAFQGTKINLTSQILSLSKARASSGASVEEDDGYLAEFYFNDQKLSSQKIIDPRKNVDVVFDYPTEKLNPLSVNIFSITLYRLEDGVKGRRIGYLTYKVPVIADSVKPIWLSEAIPNHQDRYTQQLRSINLKAQDSFGRIDSATFKLLLNSQGTTKDLSGSILSTKSDDGATYEFTGDLNPLDEDEYTLTAKISDLAGNPADPYNVTFRIDRTVPVLNTTLATNTLTNQTNIEVPITVSDLSPTATDIYVNNELTMTSGLKNFSVSATLTVEGDNTVRVESRDAAGNVAVAKEVVVVRDTVAPIIISSSPADGATVDRASFDTLVVTNEKLSAASINSLVLSLSNDRKSASGVYNASSLGIQDLVWLVSDLAGNSTEKTIKVNIRNRLLNPELVSVSPKFDGKGLRVSGGKGTVRGRVKIKISEGFFSYNKIEEYSNEDGSFYFDLDFFETATLTAIDESTVEEESMSLSYHVNTAISGVVLDTSGLPLAGVTVSLIGGASNTITDSNGMFQFDPGLTGDQTLVIDGRTIPATSDGNVRAFSYTNISINIGIGQNNALSRPIYLHPTTFDGTETNVVPGVATVVESPHAPGVSLKISSDTAVFPTGVVSEAISISLIDADKATVEAPAAAVPTKVLALEPSGLSFNSRAELTLPNDNDLPPGTNMIIFSMNSKSGQWEVDGLAKVDESGNSVTTTPGNGISHFSLVYAVPVKPIIAEVSDPSLGGIDISKGSLETTAELPSFKSLGQKITPTLQYKSAWAHPTALVTNVFDIPTQKISADYKSNGSTSTVKTLKFEFCKKRLFASDKCWVEPRDFFINSYFDTSLRIQSEYQPESIKSQFFVSGLAGNSIEFVKNSASGTIPGAVPSQSLNSVIKEVTGIPNNSLISFGVKLGDENGYLESGLYPAFARYQVKLRNITLTSITRNVSTYINGELKNVQTVSRNDESSKVLESAMPSDVHSNLIVQNKTKSPFGRGWNLNLTKRILNPTKNKVVIEEMDGAVKTYSINNTISTVADGKLLGVSFSTVAALKDWPKILTQKRTNDSRDYVVEVQVEPSGSNTVTNVGLIGSYEGQWGSADRTLRCAYTTSWTYHRWEYRYQAKINSLIKLPNNAVYGTNQAQHGIFSIDTNGYKQQAGYTQIWYQNPVSGMEPNLVPNHCASFGIKCFEPSTSSSSYGCSNSFPYYGNSKFISRKGTFGPIAQAGYDNGNGNFYGGSMGINSPHDLILAKNGDLILADLGNNKVRKIKLSGDGSIQTIAGTGANGDYGDGGLGNQASLFHPRGLALDGKGNLYISTENGYIRRVDPNGIISTFAGKPLTLGGDLANEAPAESIALNNPSGLVFDDVNQYLYIADTGNHRIVRVDTATMQAQTVAGTGQCSLLSKDENVAALNASLCSPLQIGLDSNQNLLVSNSGKNRIQIVRFNNSNNGALAFAPTNKDLSKLERNQDGSWKRTHRNGNIDIFNSTGLLTQTNSRVGNIVNYQYDINNNLISVIDPVGQELTISYLGEKVSTITDAAGRATHFQFTGDNLTKITYPDGTSKRYNYDENGLLVSEFDALDYETKYEYNSYSRIKKKIDPNTQETLFEDIESQSADSSTLNKSTIAGEGYSSKLGNSTSTIEYSKDLSGYISTTKDPMGRITKIERDLNGNVVKVTNPDTSERTFKYDPNTFDMIESYDVQHDIRRVATTDSFGKLLSYTDGNGGTFIKEYHATSGLLIKEKSPIAGIEVSYLHNSKGLVLQKVLKKGAEYFISKLNYDNNGNVIEEISPSGNITLFSYDNAGNLTKTTKKTSGTITAIENYEYDSLNRLKKVISAKNETTEYTYLPTGLLETIVDPKNKVTSFQYNSMGQITRRQQATGEVYTYTYDPAGKWSQETDPNGNIKTFEYNANNKVVKIQTPDDIVNYEYDGKDQVKSASNKNSKITYTRDSLDRVIADNFIGQGMFSSIAPLNIESVYDKNNNRVKTTLNNSVVFNYTFDELNRLTSISNSYGDVFNYEFDSLSRMTKVLRPNGETNYEYNADGLPSQIQHKGNGILKQQFQYGYDLRNFVNQKRTPSTTENYSHDANGQLIAKDGSGENEAYVYDSLGNRVMDNQSSYTYDSNNQRLLEDYTFTYLYDNNGNLIAKNPKNPTQKAYRYEYSATNQLKSVSTLENPFGSVIHKVNFEYDVLGRRMRKEIVSQAVPANNGYTLYYYDGENVVFETKYLTQTGAFGVVAAYTHGLGQDNVLAVNIPALGVTNKKAKQAGNYYFVKDNQGSVTGILSSNGSIQEQYSYSSYGKILKIQDEAGADLTFNRFIDNQYTFTGREYDSEINTYYYRARYYDANIGRFLQQDPDAGKIDNPISLINKYVYANNSPLMFSDPTGRSSIFGWLAIAISPGLSLLLLNTTKVFERNFGFTEGDKKAVNFAAVTAAIIVLSILTGGTAGAAFGGGWAGAAAGAVVGAMTGAAVGMIGFPALGLGSAGEGAMYGAVVGGIAGGIAGYMASPVPAQDLAGTAQDCWDLALGAVGLIGGVVLIGMTAGAAAPLAAMWAIPGALGAAGGGATAGLSKVGCNEYRASIAGL